ncbi:17319_t:CDS:2 [Cetraspora pellucida]|uniref:17319_t:CDS:1 n=1 Tax=Cetraspora pellucida TaxID=1433469 RepID=A0A9N9PA62_9GLOM|nr:17319_t:CDS:2 [Cetraspora pellucida]
MMINVDVSASKSYSLTSTSNYIYKGFVKRDKTNKKPELAIFDNQFANGKFISIEPSKNHYCPVKLLIDYMLIRPKISDAKSLFLSQQGKQLTVGAIRAVIKRMVKLAGLKADSWHTASE